MKFFTFLCAIIFVVMATSYAQISVGIRGGYINTGLESADNNVAPPTKNANSWQVGLYTNVPLFRNGYLQPGLNYIVKGAKLDYLTSHPNNVLTSGVTRLNLQYLELPVHIVYKVPIGIGNFVLGAGPYVAYSTGARYKVVAYNNDKQVESSFQRVNFDATPNIFGTGVDLQRWDAGLSFIGGIELNSSVTLNAHYGYGMVDIDRSGHNSYKNRYWGISLGFFFNREDW